MGMMRWVDEEKWREVGGAEILCLASRRRRMTCQLRPAEFRSRYIITVGNMQEDVELLGENTVG